jgi:transcriptional regulator with XRE-family HTH domain
MTEDKTILSLFGRNVRQERLDKGLSQEQLAELSNLHRTYIGMIERAEKNITLINANKVAKALNVSLVKLLHNDK